MLTGSQPQCEAGPFSSPHLCAGDCLPSKLEAACHCACSRLGLVLISRTQVSCHGTHVTYKAPAAQHHTPTTLCWEMHGTGGCMNPHHCCIGADAAQAWQLMPPCQLRCAHGTLQSKVRPGWCSAAHSLDQGVAEDVAVFWREPAVVQVQQEVANGVRHTLLLAAQVDPPDEVQPCGTTDTQTCRSAVLSAGIHAAQARHGQLIQCSLCSQGHVPF